MIKRGIVFIVMLLLLVDLVEDGHLGYVKSGPLQAAVSHVLSHFPRYPAKQYDSFNLLPSSDWRNNLAPKQFQSVICISQLILELTTICINGSSGGIPR